MISTKNHGQKLKKKLTSRFNWNVLDFNNIEMPSMPNPWAVLWVMCMKRKKWKDSPSHLIWKSECTLLHSFIALGEYNCTIIMTVNEDDSRCSKKKKLSHSSFHLLHFQTTRGRGHNTFELSDVMYIGLFSTYGITSPEFRETLLREKIHLSHSI